MELLSSSEGKKFYNFLINASNQANLIGNQDTLKIQLNAAIIAISPYTLEKFGIEGLNVDIKLDKNGDMSINNQKLSGIEVEEGVKVFGVVCQKDIDKSFKKDLEDNALESEIEIFKEEEEEEEG